MSFKNNHHICWSIELAIQNIYPVCSTSESEYKEAYPWRYDFKYFDNKICWHTKSNYLNYVDADVLKKVRQEILFAVDESLPKYNFHLSKMPTEIRNNTLIENETSYIRSNEYYLDAFKNNL